MEKHHIWYSFLALGPITAFLAVFNPSFSVLAVVFMIIAAKGILVDIL